MSETSQGKGICMVAVLQRFFNIKRKVSNILAALLPQVRDSLFEVYEDVVIHYMNEKPGQVIGDVGGGKSCPFSGSGKPGFSTRIIAVDILEEKLRHNRDVDEVRVADTTRVLPFGEREVDLIVSRSVLEHPEDLGGFIASSRVALRSEGYFMHLLPCGYAPVRTSLSLREGRPRAGSRTRPGRRGSDHESHSCVRDGCAGPAFSGRYQRFSMVSGSMSSAGSKPKTFE